LIFLLPNSAHALPDYKDVRQNYLKSDSLLLDRHGAVLHELRTDKDHRRLDWTLLGNISPALQQAVVNAEDKNFYAHSGVDYTAISASLFQSLLRQNPRGASTITMQLASFLAPGLQPKKGRRTLGQKWKQMGTARELEKNWTKTEIFEAYLNLLSFRGELQGVAAASRALFDKEPHGLDHTEAAILAALIRSPNANYDALIQRSSQIMLTLDWKINPAELQSKIEKIFWGTNYIQPRTTLAAHIALRLLKNEPKGATVTCTLDSRLQRFVPDVMIGVSARPFSKSFSSHVQQMGRIMRPYDGKEYGLWLDHSGNYLRFRKEWDTLFEEGVTELHNGAETAKKEPPDKEKKEAKCPACSALWVWPDRVCGECGYERPVKQILNVAGELTELETTKREVLTENQKFYSELIYFARLRGYKEGWAAHKYKEKYGAYPRGLHTNPVATSTKTSGWIQSRNIAWAKSKANK
jgi:hypothetical protein